MDRKKSPQGFRTSLHGLPYNDTVPAEPPLHITHSLNLSSEESNPIKTAASKLQREQEGKRDSGIANSSLADSTASVNTESRSVGSLKGSLKSSRSIPQIRVDNQPLPISRSGFKSWTSVKSTKSKTESEKPDEEFKGLNLDLPSSSLGEDISTSKMQFSKRGSVMINGQKINRQESGVATAKKSGLSGGRIMSNPALGAKRPERVLSSDEEMLSQRVRSFYDLGTDDADSTDQKSSIGRQSMRREHSGLSDRDENSQLSRQNSDLYDDSTSTRHRLPGMRRSSLLQREEDELAGGLEDWHDVDNEDVDRYGFILPKSDTIATLSSTGVKRTLSTREPQPIQRVSTALQLAADTPRQKHSMRRSPSTVHRSDSVQHSHSKLSSRPVSSQSSYQGTLAGANSRLRTATNKLPHNRDRKLVDEAGDMLNLPLGLADIAEHGQLSLKEAHAKRKETEREEKWRKMARVVSKGQNGSGMVFDFDTRSPKLIERTWKGIPEKWRATAWHAFLSESAKRRTGCLTDDQLIEAYEYYQSIGSPDDTQIDIDVPRTISSHIMFRRRYRGGQRLLFRVLHATSLHFPDTGYVQGMAALAATLLAYYDEENAFVMLARLWELRGLDKLYKSGFGGLMEALDDFEKGWLGSGEVGAKLVSKT